MIINFGDSSKKRGSIVVFVEGKLFIDPCTEQNDTYLK